MAATAVGEMTGTAGVAAAGRTAGTVTMTETEIEVQTGKGAKSETETETGIEVVSVTGTGSGTEVMAPMGTATGDAATSEVARRGEAAVGSGIATVRETRAATDMALGAMPAGTRAPVEL